MQGDANNTAPHFHRNMLIPQIGPKAEFTPNDESHRFPPINESVGIGGNRWESVGIGERKSFSVNKHRFFKKISADSHRNDSERIKLKTG